MFYGKALRSTQKVNKGVPAVSIVQSTSKDQPSNIKKSVKLKTTDAKYAAEKDTFQNAAEASNKWTTVILSKKRTVIV